MRPVRVLMLSWEYPPLLVGGLGRHVHAPVSYTHLTLPTNSRV